MIRKSPGGIASLAASPSLGRVMLQNRFASQPGWPYFTASGSLNFTRDTSGLITSISGDKQLGATYDPDLQISSINHILPQPFAESYTYDDNGNRLTSLTNSFIYDDLNRLTESTTHEYTYDADGNMTQEKNKLTTEAKKYYYDSEIPKGDSITSCFVKPQQSDANRMAKYEHLASDISPIDITATYKYDIFGRRLQKNVNGAITNFFWENDTMTYELNDQYQPIRKYLTGVGIDNYEGHLEYSEITDWSHIFWPEYNQPWYSYMKDQVGTVYKVHSLKTRSIEDVRTYDSFGNLVNQSGTNKTPLGFQGKYYDAESGLNYFYHRYYNPAIGRFTSEDPVEFEGGLNLFKFNGDNPVNIIDPFGLYNCTYSISHHRMICIPNHMTYPTFDSSDFVAGNNNAPGPLNCNCQNNQNQISYYNHGPIPIGDYTIGQQRSNSSRRDLIPSLTNIMYGRASFQIHGCGNPANCSRGCIAAINNVTRDRFNFLMSLEEGDNILHVTQ
jgi:RHS repeat-associated protein